MWGLKTIIEIRTRTQSRPKVTALCTLLSISFLPSDKTLLIFSFKLKRIIWCALLLRNRKHRLPCSFFFLKKTNMYFAIELSSRENLFRCARARAHFCARIAHEAHFCALIAQGAHSLLRGPILYPASWIYHLGFRSNISKKLRIGEI